MFEAEYHVSKVFALCLHLGDFGFVLLVCLLQVLAHCLAYVAVAALFQDVLADAGIDAVGYGAVSSYELQAACDFHQLVLAYEFHAVDDERCALGAVCGFGGVLAVVFLASCARCHCDDG